MYNVFVRPFHPSLIGQSFPLPLPCPVTTLIHLFFTNVTVTITTVYPFRSTAIAAFHVSYFLLLAMVSTPRIVIFI